MLTIPLAIVFIHITEIGWERFWIIYPIYSDILARHRRTPTPQNNETKNECIDNLMTMDEKKINKTRENPKPIIIIRRWIQYAPTKCCPFGWKIGSQSIPETRMKQGFMNK